MIGMENLHSLLSQEGGFASNVASYEPRNQRNHRQSAQMIQSRILLAEKRCASTHHFDVFFIIAPHVFVIKRCAIKAQTFALI